MTETERAEEYRRRFLLAMKEINDLYREMRSSAAVIQQFSGAVVEIPAEVADIVGYLLNRLKDAERILVEVDKLGGVKLTREQTQHPYVATGVQMHMLMEVYRDKWKQPLASQGPPVVQDPREDAFRLLRRIISELPVNRDWLDPDLEKSARALISNVEKGLNVG